MKSNFARESIHVARKIHKCDICGGQIEIGDTYRRIQGVQDGEFVQMRTHLSYGNGCRFEDGIDSPDDYPYYPKD